MLTGPSVQRLRGMLGTAGFDLTRLPGEDRRSDIFAALDAQFAQMDEQEKARAVSALARRLIEDDDERLEVLRRALQGHGFDYFEGNFIPVGLVDDRDRAFLPDDALPDLSKALSRLAMGDYSGAVGAACGAVDSVTQRLYEERGLGTPPNSFQAKVNTLLGPLWENLQERFVEDGMGAGDAEELVGHLRGNCNASAHALQVMRRTLGDVHGDRPATVQTAYHAIKAAAGLCGMLVDGL